MFKINKRDIYAKNNMGVPFIILFANIYSMVEPEIIILAKFVKKAIL